VDKLNATGLRATQGDIQLHLKQLENASIGGVFCAQVVEHLAPDSVYNMLAELHRVMKPTAPLVIETVNPLSVFAYHHLFFKDPTHVFPVHPDTLVFMLRYTGFQEVQAHLITPVPEQQKLPEPKREDFAPEGYEYLKMITARLNQLLYDSLEYYVAAARP
jgi:O-antigen chain-terminating methyltransferase